MSLLFIILLASLQSKASSRYEINIEPNMMANRASGGRIFEKPNSFDEQKTGEMPSFSHLVISPFASRMFLSCSYANNVIMIIPLKNSNLLGLMSIDLVVTKISAIHKNGLQRF
jgi:hypothetical protein